MKNPVGFKVFGVFQILIGITFFLIGFFGYIEQYNNTYVSIIAAALFLSISLWTIITALSWFFEFKISYLVLILNIIVIIGFLTLFNIRLFTKNQIVPSDINIAILVSFLFGIYLLFMIIYSVLKSTRAYINQEENKPNKIATISTIVGSIMIFIIPVSIIFFLQKFSYSYLPVECTSIISSGDYGDYTIDNIYDNDLKTWWTPQNHHGRNSWIKYNFYPAKEVNAIKIHPGSHYPNYKNIGDLFQLNGRLLKAKLIFDDGSFQTIEIEDRDELQIISFNKKITTKITLKVIATAKGKKWDDLCISEAQILRKTSFLIE